MKIIFMGTPEFACPILEMLVQKHDVLLVVTQPDKPVGRKKEYIASPVKSLALTLGLNVFQPIKLKDDYQNIINLNADLIVTAAYGQMLPKALLDAIKALNVHGSLLPKYRGGAPIQYALFDGLNQTGVTIMYMAFQMDSGDLIKQRTVDIESEDDYQTLSRKLSLVGAKLLEEVLVDLEEGRIQRKPQDNNLVSFAYTLKHSDELISFDQKTQIIIQRIQGLSPEPGGYAKINETTLKIFKASNSDIIEHNTLPGTVISVNKKFLIKTLDGVIELHEVQIPGKKKMQVKDFLNGQNIIQKGDVFIKGDV